MSARHRPRRAARRGAAPAPSAPTLAIPHLDLALALGASAVAGALYWLTAARDIVVGDTPELTAAALTLGVAHPPGYPVLMVLGHLFGWLPLGPPPFRVNLAAVVCGALTVGLAYGTAQRLVRDRALALLAAALLAASLLFWEWSLAFEAFPLNNLIAAAMLFLLVWWHDEPERTPLLAGAALLAGLGLANHQSIVLLGPAVLYLLWHERRHLHARTTVPICAAALAVGLLAYAYVPWAAARAPFWNWMGVASFGDLLALVSRQNYGTGQLVNVPGLAGGSAVQRVGAQLASFNWVELALLVLGTVGAYLWQRWFFWFALLAFVFTGPLFAGYANANIAADYVLWVFTRFFLLSHVVAAPVMALGLVFAVYLVRELAVFAGRSLPAWAPAAALALPIVAVIFVTVVGSYRSLDLSQNQVARMFGEDILSSVETGGVLIASGDEMVGPLAYLQTVESHRPDVELVIGPLLTEAWYVAQLRVRFPDLALPFVRMRIDAGRMRELLDANRGRTIYSIGTLLDAESLGDAYVVRPYGLVSRIDPAAVDASAGQLDAENERLWQRYAPPPADSIRAGTFERSILIQYTAAARRVGVELERAEDITGARHWYQRALEVTEDRAARDGLNRVGTRS